MAVIERVEICMVDLKPKVKRTDAIQSFDSQETPIVRITDKDGATGTGYSYTIGQGGGAVMSLLRETLVPQLIGREAEEIERIWRDLLFSTHATAVGAITSLALAAIDTALWDLRCRRAELPLWSIVRGQPGYCLEAGSVMSTLRGQHSSVIVRRGLLNFTTPKPAARVVSLPPLGSFDGLATA